MSLESDSENGEGWIDSWDIKDIVNTQELVVAWREENRTYWEVKADFWTFSFGNWVVEVTKYRDKSPMRENFWKGDKEFSLGHIELSWKSWEYINNFGI